MKVFCPNCGTQNDGMPGGRLTCKACTASFEVPREGGVVAQPPPQVIAPPPVMSPPPPSSSPFPGGYVGPPPTGFGTGTGLSSSGTNPLAIASLVLGILCCFPFSVGAIITGVIAHNQINASNGMQRGRELAMAGIVLGALSLVAGIGFSLLSVLGRIR